MTLSENAGRLRILMIGDGFKPAIGGAETVSYELSKRLVERGHAVTVLTRRVNSPWPEKETIDGIEVRRYDDPPLPRPLVYVAFDAVSIVRAKRAFESLLADHAFDVIVMHCVVSPLGVCLSRRARLTPKVLVFHGPFHLEFAAQFGEKASGKGRGLSGSLRQAIIRLKLVEKRMQQRLMIKKAARVVVFSRYNLDNVKDLAPGLPPEKMYLMPAGVDLDRFRPTEDRESLQRELGLGGEQVVLFTLRRLAPRMGLDNLIRAMPRVLAEVGEALLLIGGDGPMRLELESLVDRLGLADRVRFLGRLGDAEMVRYYQAADLFILPTRAVEGFGLPTLESLACGLPVLGTPVGATPEILGKLSPDLLTAGSGPEEIAGGIVRFLHSFGPTNQALRERCRRLVEEEYAWEKAVGRFEELLREVIGEGCRGK